MDQIENKAEYYLKTIFGYNSFRANQQKIIEAILDHKDVFASMPTGGGKSLCYQIPSLCFEGITIVVSPLVSLMKDQVDGAIESGIKAAYINSTLSAKESKKTYQRLFSGDIKLLYLSPERLALEGYFETLKDLPISFFAIDEAHCLSEWGHDFRPSYFILKEIKEHFPHIPLAAFTATATSRVQEDIINILNLKDPLIVRASFNRKELFYWVEPKDNVKRQILGFIKDHPNEAGIVYRNSRKDVESTCEYLVKNGIRALAYHAGLSKAEREENQEAFNSDDIDIIVATIAFGMGINKINTRFVIHGDLPKNMEGYYQETGRAGRDGLESHCLLLYGPGDIMKVQYHLDKMENLKEKEKAEANLQRMASFASVYVCRRKQILEYFNEPFKGDCGFCDVCTGQVERVSATVNAQKVMSAILRTNEVFGAMHIIDIVQGADTEKIRKFNHQKIKTYGVGKDKSKKWWRGLIEELLRQGALKQDKEAYKALKITEKGREILFGRQPFYTIKKEDTLVLPKSREINLKPGDETLYIQLKDLRSTLAKKRGVPPYIIFSDKTLKDMARLKPIDQSGLLRVSGVGETKLAQYGPEFIRAIKSFLGY